MTDDPDFAAFWAVFPRKEDKPEARHQWRHAAFRFGADHVILAAARYAASVRALSRAGITPPGTWLRSLVAPERRPGIFGLDLEKVGSALLTACITSRQAGHANVTNTIRDYVMPHGPFSPEQEFAFNVLLGTDPVELITQDELVAWLQQREWAEPGLRSA